MNSSRIFDKETTRVFAKIKDKTIEIPFEDVVIEALPFRTINPDNLGVTDVTIENVFTIKDGDMERIKEFFESDENNESN